MLKRALTMAGLVAIVGCAHLSVAPQSGLVDATGHPTTLPQLLPRLNGVTYLLVGEDHSNPCDHDWEAKFAEATGASEPVVIGFEMVSIDEQPVLDCFNAGSLDAAALGPALDWDKRWGFPYALYQPIFEAARRHTAPVIALNVPKEIEHAVGSGGLETLTPAQRKDVVPELIPPPPAEEQMLREAMASHAGHPMNWDRFIRVQSLWDSEMAFRAVEAHRQTGKPVIIFAGGGHVENGWGIAYRLARLDPGAHILSVMPARPGETLDRSEADLFFSCPASE